MRLYILLALAVSIITLPFAFAYESKTDNSHLLSFPAGDERKQAFIQFLKPIINEVNQSLLQDRQKLIRLRDKAKLNIREQRWLKHIAQQYSDNTFDLNNENHWLELINKVDLIPESLVIAQGAKESGWGSSRFAQKGNNYFGQWCYTKGCGLIPKNRNHGAIHEVAKYDTVKQSALSYINNLNNHPAYKDLRDIRRQLRIVGKQITGHQLAKGLQKYSERGDVYIKEIQALIRSNKLDTLKSTS